MVEQKGKQFDLLTFSHTRYRRFQILIRNSHRREDDQPYSHHAKAIAVLVAVQRNVVPLKIPIEKLKAARPLLLPNQKM